MGILSDASAEIMKTYALKLVKQILAQDSYVFNTVNSVDLLCNCYIALSEYHINETTSEALKTIRQDPLYRLSHCKQLLFIAKDAVIYKDPMFQFISLIELDQIILF